MASHHHEHVSVDEQYSLTAEAKRRIFTVVGVGVVLFILGIVLLAFGVGQGGHDDHGAAHATEAHATTGGHDEHAKSTTGASGDHAQTGRPVEKARSFGESESGKAEGPEYGSTANKAQGHDTHESGGAVSHHGYHWTTRLWANLWLNNVFFTGIALIGVFFVAVNYAAWAGWSAVIKRVPESFGSWLPFAGVTALVIFGIAHHDLFHWTHSELYDKSSPAYDPIIDGKAWYLTMPFYLARMVIFYAVWYLLWRMMRTRSLEEDIKGGVENYNRMIVLSAIFLVFFAVSESMSSWDWVMSIDTHWYSTLFGWYMFASWFVTGLATITLSVLLLKEKGLLKAVNSNHLHDLGKFMFAFSIFWTYLWFAQFLLIYYANIPEETIYFKERMDGHNGVYTPIFFLNIIVNFFFPFLFLMTRDAKRQTLFLKIAAIGIIFGHYLDFYMMIMPGTVGENAGYGPLEMGTTMIFAGLFVFVISTALSKAKLIAQNHPMLQESLHHDI